MTTIVSTNLVPDVIQSEIKKDKLIPGKNSFENLIRGKSGKGEADKSHPTRGMDDLSHNIVTLFEQTLKNAGGEVSSGGDNAQSLGKVISTPGEKTAILKVAGKQESKIVFNKNEQKALSTYVLSYVNTNSSDPEINVLSSIDTVNSSQSVEGNAHVKTVTNFAVGEKKISAGHQFSELAISGKTEKDNESKIGFSYMRTLYEKFKITLLGGKEKTVVIRDYYSDGVYSVTDFQKAVESETLHVKKLIRNGKEI
jgi:hypothetical protein